MLKVLKVLAVAAAACAGLASQSYAQTAAAAPASQVAGQCKGEIFATGHGAILDKAGPEKAIDAWRNEAVTRFGVFYGDPTKANEGKGVVVENCGRTLLGLLVCSARGRPCQSVTQQTTDAGVPEIPCDPRDGRYCDPTVKWVQSRLAAKGYKIAIDGVAGAGTAAIIKTYRASNNLPAGANIDDGLIASLKS